MGELYNYKVVDNAIVFRVLYMIINRGHAVRPGTPSHRNALRLCLVDPVADLGVVRPQGEFSALVRCVLGSMHPSHSPSPAP